MYYKFQSLPYFYYISGVTRFQRDAEAFCNQFNIYFKIDHIIHGRLIDNTATNNAINILLYQVSKEKSGQECFATSSVYFPYVVACSL